MLENGVERQDVAVLRVDVVQVRLVRRRVAVTDGLAGGLAIAGIFVASRLRTPNAAVLG